MTESCMLSDGACSPELAAFGGAGIHSVPVHINFPSGLYVTSAMYVEGDILFLIPLAYFSSFPVPSLQSEKQKYKCGYDELGICLSRI